MTSLTLGTLRARCAPLGPVNPLPPLRGLEEIHAVGPDVPAALAASLRYGRMRSVYPYLNRDGYSRDLVDTDLRVAVLDNGVLRAGFLLDLGGRLWSLVDRRTGRELLYRPGALRFANLALRDAWFAGGVEWNTGTTGHWPGTTEPVHAARVTGARGEPVLRMYEWDRLRDTLFQIDAWLEDGGDRLYVYVRVANPNAHPVPMYWWSNAAVPQRPGVRVLAPADSAYHFGYERALAVVPVPVHDGRDLSYPAAHEFAADYFFRIGSGTQPWIASVDRDGTGLLHASTARLRGRKLFVWGTGTGGRHWQRWLGGDPDTGYLEIQAGLASTQLEHLPMPAGAAWSWVESYGPLAVDPALAHHPDWDVARAAVRETIERDAPLAALEERRRAADARAADPPADILHAGSGWGPLELYRRRLAGAPATFTGTPFRDGTLGPEQEPWVTLLDTGALPAAPVERPPASYVNGPHWRALLAAAPATWETELHLGHIAHAAGDLSTAESRYGSSLDLRTSAWALRALALVRAEQGDAATAADLLARAHLLEPDLLPVALELGDALLAAGRPAEVLDLVDRLGGRPGGNGRPALLAAMAAVECARPDRVASVLGAPLEVANIREGDGTLERLWVRFRALLGDDEDTGARSLPAHYDFRMKPVRPHPATSARDGIATGRDGLPADRRDAGR